MTDSQKCPKSDNSIKGPESHDLALDEGNVPSGVRYPLSAYGNRASVEIFRVVAAEYAYQQSRRSYGTRFLAWIGHWFRGGHRADVYSRNRS
jgi:hypothetical protein